MTQDWPELLKITHGSPLTIERVRAGSSGIAVEGSFELPPLARLTMEDQVFITAFIKCHGSIKEMESLFGISYPTVKNRLNRIAGYLEFVEIVVPSTQEEILDRLDTGDLSVEEAIEKMKGGQ
ncbi:MAG TPA: DUF2089 domain-containing protein [Spirochaetota bacterium]|nr:DUF2089 domain-containing protein [Spirochaetota bacterium]